MHVQSLYFRGLLFCCVMAAHPVHAEDKTFYTILTPDGPMQVEMPAPSRRAQVSKPAVAATVPAAAPIPAPIPATVSRPEVQPAASMPTEVSVPKRSADPDPDIKTETVANPAAVHTAKLDGTTRQTASPQPAIPSTAATTSEETAKSAFFDFAGQQYVDTAYLEQREFNLEGRKRFYSLPDGLGGTQVVERESGVRLSSFIPQFERAPAISLAENYRRVTASALLELTNQQCLVAAQLKTAKRLNDQPVDFWPRPGFQPKFEFVLAELEPSLRDIHLMSYSATSRQPSYYWPLPIFLDQRGCVLEGVAGFYQSKTPATWLQQSALQGHLHIPNDARYLLLTPLVEAAELSGETLADRGQLRLTPLRLAAP